MASKTSEPQWRIDESAGEALKGRPLFFFKAEQAYGYFCQWYLADFVDEEGLKFNCSEQYMMYHKAKAFKDTASMAAIMESKNPAVQKRLGRTVKGFSAAAWDKIKFEVVVQGNMLKFTQGSASPKDRFVYDGNNKMDHEEPISLKRLLLATGELELCEASRFDRVWGIGYSADDATRQSRSSWGENLLGKALMEVRARLRSEG